jgi:hypothetical protein
LESTPNRLRGLYGAAKAAEAASQPEKATAYFRKLAELTKDADTDRVEVREAKAYSMQRGRAGPLLQTGWLDSITPLDLRAALVSNQNVCLDETRRRGFMRTTFDPRVEADDLQTEPAL